MFCSDGYEQTVLTLYGHRRLNYPLICKKNAIFKSQHSKIEKDKKLNEI